MSVPDSSAPVPHHSDIRDPAGFALAAGLFAILVMGASDLLTPPIVFPLFVWAVWPLHARSEIRSALMVAGALMALWFFGEFGSVLTPFILSVGVAYVIAPVVGLLTARRVPRGIAILLVVLPILAIFATIAAVAGPQLVDQSEALVVRLPGFADRAVTWLASFGDRLATLPFLNAAQKSWLNRLDAAKLGLILQGYAQIVFRSIGDFGLGLFSHVGNILGFLAYLVVVPVVTFYLLLDWAMFTATIEGLIPTSRRAGVVAFVHEYDHGLGRYIRGQLTEATLVGTVTMTGLLLLGVPSALLLGVITGVLNLIPYIGFFVSIIPALIVALTMEDPVNGLLRVGAVFFVIQLMDGHVTGPRIVGHAVGLHPIWIMISMTLSGTFFGLPGLLLAIPLAVLVKMLLVRGLARYEASGVYTSG